MAAAVQQGLVRHRIVAPIAISLLVVSGAAVFLGIALTLFACVPANTGDAGFLIRGGPTILVGGAFGMSKGRRILQLSGGPNLGRPRRLRWSVELLWVAGLLAFAYFTTRFLLDASPWSTVPVTFYGSHGVSHVVPLPFLLRAWGSLVAIKLGPILASARFSRRIPSTRIAAIGGVMGVTSAMLAYLDSREFPAAPYVLALFVLDLALCVTFATLALESPNAEEQGRPTSR